MKTELVTSLKRKATEIISELAVNHDPVLITQHGRPAAYLIDVDSYEQIKKRIQILEGIALGEEAVRAGETVTQKEAKQRLSKWLK
jgi:prevent-host-death family protein